jgi:hypothetical protein
MVDIFVGPDKQRFHVYKKLLCSRVPYFEKMFQEGGFIESVDDTATLPEDDPATFSLFLEWLYTARLAPLDISKSTQTSGPFVNRIKLYQFAHKLCLLNLADYTMTNMMSNYDHHNGCPSQFAVSLAYRITGPGSHLRSYMLHNLLFQAETGKLGTQELCRAFIGNEDLIIDYISIKDKWDDNPSVDVRSDPQKKSRCLWHYHEKDGECAFKDEIL